MKLEDQERRDNGWLINDAYENNKTKLAFKVKPLFLFSFPLMHTNLSD